MGDNQFQVIFICTGNQARSAIAESYFRAATAGLPVLVSSAGLLDTGGTGALPEAATAASRWGLDLATHRSRHFSKIDKIADADLVLGFERRHVAAVVVDGGADPNKTFTLLELVRLLEEVPAPGDEDSIARARAAIAAAARVRESAQFVPGEELADPAGRDQRFFENTAADIVRLCDTLIEQLFVWPVKPEVRSDSGAERSATDAPAAGIREDIWK